MDTHYTQNDVVLLKLTTKQEEIKENLAISSLKNPNFFVNLETRGRGREIGGDCHHFIELEPLVIY